MKRSGKVSEINPTNAEWNPHLLENCCSNVPAWCSFSLLDCELEWSGARGGLVCLGRMTLVFQLAKFSSRGAIGVRGTVLDVSVGENATNLASQN